MSLRVQYVIFTKNEALLRTHLEYLSKIKHHVTQITVITQNKTLDKTQMFDYTIFANDTTMGIIPYFDTYLIILYQAHNGVFLCSPHDRSCGIMNHATLLQTSPITSEYTFPDPLLESLTSFNHKLTLGFLDETVAGRRMRYFAHPSVAYLDLSNQHLNDTILSLVMHAELRHLDLTHNLISDASIPVFLKYPLEILILDHNHISNDGIEMLAKHTTLKKLSLLDNLITSIRPLCQHATLKEIYVDDHVE